MIKSQMRPPAQFGESLRLRKSRSATLVLPVRLVPAIHRHYALDPQAHPEEHHLFVYQMVP